MTVRTRNTATKSTRFIGPLAGMLFATVLRMKNAVVLSLLVVGTSCASETTRYSILEASLVERSEYIGTRTIQLRTTEIQDAAPFRIGLYRLEDTDQAFFNLSLPAGDVRPGYVDSLGPFQRESFVGASDTGRRGAQNGSFGAASGQLEILDGPEAGQLLFHVVADFDRPELRATYEAWILVEDSGDRADVSRPSDSWSGPDDESSGYTACWIYC